MTRGWKRRENLDLWKMLDAEAAQRKVGWEWVRGHSGDTCNERADELARNAALDKPQYSQLDYPTHKSARSAELHAEPQGPAVDSSSAEQSLPKMLPSLTNEETTEADNEVEIARLLRPLLAEGETLRRCAGCHRAFVATGNPARMRAYCSLAACQLKRRRTSSS
jgi:hypothetical protein